MNAVCSCGGELKHRAENSSGIRPERMVRFSIILRRFLGTIRWLTPVIVFSILPKCPFCFAAYVAVGTGIGLSLTTATYLRMFLIVICFASFLFMLTKWFRRRYLRASAE